MADIDVTLVVDTDNLPANPTDSPASACLLYDSALDPDSGPSTGFTIGGIVGDNIIFHIVAKNNTTPVSFSSFAYESGNSGVLSTLPASSNNWVGVVGGSKGDSEAFYINFNANGNTYKLDPEVEVDGP
ncbi:hypothetical protein [Reichenbachiella sp.]|uniref:hypothetical protein n=1 Tax=Reichenbachiella sp. TaxID=2184521 RepID=UPI003BAF6B4D